MLIVGTGPAGTVLAAQLAEFPGIATRIVERRGGPLELGQADGVACRTVEMFEAFGLSEQLVREAYWVNETVFWRPDAARPLAHRAHRSGAGRRGRPVRVPARHRQPGAHAAVSARVHAPLAEPARARLRPRVRRGSRSTGRATIRSPSRCAAPMRARDGEEITVRARYVVGCDGARSRVRAVDRARAARRHRQPRLGRDRHPRRHRLPRHPPQGRDPVRRQGQHPDHPARRRLPRAPLRRPRRGRPRRPRRGARHARPSRSIAIAGACCTRTRST